MSKEPIYLLALAALMFYVASRFAAQAFGGTVGRAVGHALPLILLATAAAGLGMDALAVDVLTAAAATCLTLVVGVAIMTSPLQATSPSRRVWPLLLPVTAIVWTAGAMSAIDLRVAGALLGVGAVVGWTAYGTRVPTAVKQPTRREPLRWVIIALSVLVSCMGVLATLLSVRITLSAVHQLTPGLLATMIVAPILILPILGAVSDLAQAGHSSDKSISVAIATALLALCLGVPAAAVAHAARAHYYGVAGMAALPVPYGVWRSDATILIIASLLLAPIGLGRWLPTRLEGILLVLIYVIYLYMASPLSAMSMG